MAGGSSTGAEGSRGAEATSSPGAQGVPPTHATSAGAGATTVELPSDTEVLVRRVVNGPRPLVWRAWMSPEHVPNWLLGPPGWAMPVCEMDVRPGGAWRMVWRNDEGQELEMVGVYREIAPPERVVNTERWGPEWPETINTVSFAEDEPGRTTVTLRILYPSRDARDAALKTGMTEGMEATFARLDKYLPTVS